MPLPRTAATNDGVPPMVDDDNTCAETVSVRMQVLRVLLACVSVYFGINPMLRMALHGGSEHGDSERRIDARYAELHPHLPMKSTTIGYLSDADLSAERGDGWEACYFQAQYTLAPHLLIREPNDAPFIVADLRDSSLLNELVSRLSLEVLFTNGETSLLRRRDGDRQ